MPYKWKDKKKQYQKDYHAKWYSENRETQRARQNKRKLEIRQWFADYKAKLKCNRCPENHPGCLDFHHVDGKDMNLSVLVARGSSKKRILAEIAMCEVLCANCHRKEHWHDRTIFPSLDSEDLVG